MAIKKGDPGYPVVSIANGQHQFDEVICDIGSSVNIIPKVIYDNVLQFRPPAAFKHTSKVCRLVDPLGRRNRR